MKKKQKKKKIFVEDLIIQEMRQLVDYLEERYNCLIRYNIDEIRLKVKE